MRLNKYERAEIARLVREILANVDNRHALGTATFSAVAKVLWNLVRPDDSNHSWARDEYAMILLRERAEGPEFEFDTVS